MDVSTRRVTLETPGAAGRPANGESANPDISRDGRYVVFESIAGNLTDVEFAPRYPSRLLEGSADGRHASALDQRQRRAGEWSEHEPGDQRRWRNRRIHLVGRRPPRGREHSRRQHWRVPHATRIEEAHTSGRDEPGAGAAGQSAFPAISGDGRYVAFMSRADLTCRDGSCRADDAPDANGVFDIYVRDTVRRHTTRVSRGRVGDATPTARAITRRSAATGDLSRSCPRLPI